MLAILIGFKKNHCSFKLASIELFWRRFTEKCFAWVCTPAFTLLTGLVFFWRCVSCPYSEHVVTFIRESPGALTFRGGFCDYGEVTVMCVLNLCSEMCFHSSTEMEECGTWEMCFYGSTNVQECETREMGINDLK